MIRERFASGLVIDGGLATELELRGASLDDSLWSAKVLLENPLLIQKVHLDYLRAGAEVITTASYQCSFEGLKKKDLSSKQAAALMTQSVIIAQAARDLFLEEALQINLPSPLVAASLGSYGATLANGSEYNGNFPLSAKQLYDWHLPRFEVMAQSGADLIAFETIPSLKEAQALAKLLEKHPQTLAWISFSGRSNAQIGSGESFQDAVDILKSLANLLAIGINCTAPENIHSILESVSQKNEKPLLVYPNSGENWDSEQRSWNSPAVPSLEIETQLEDWRKLGVRNFGGCCRTSPKTIRTISIFCKQRS